MKRQRLLVSRRVVLGVLSLLLIVSAGAALRQANQPVAQSQLERAAAIADTLRCPTCQGLSVADSPSSIAAGMRQIIAEQVAQGRSAEQIRQFFIDRYGPWILLSPPGDGLGFLVWMLPVGVVAAGAVAATFVARRRRRESLPAPTPAQRQAAEQAYRRYAAGPETWDGSDEVEAALSLLYAVRTDTPDAGPPEPAAEERVVRAVVASMSGPRRRVVGGRAAGAPHSAPQRSRSVAWSGLVGGFTALLAVALTANLAPRLAGQFTSGNEVVAVPTPQVEVLEREAEAEPDDPRGWLRLADAAAQAGQFPRAAAAYRRALGLDPEQPDVRLALATVLLQLGAGRDALAQLEEVLRGDPNRADALLLVGYVAQQAGEKEAATFALRRLLRVAPSHPAAPMARRLLREARDG